MDHVGEVRTVRAGDGRAVVVGPLAPKRTEELFQIFSQVVADGEGYPHAAPLTRPVFEDTWIRPVTALVGAVVDGHLAGAYYLKPNQPGAGAHVANAGYVVGAAHRGRGIGRVLVEDSIERAPRAGFDAVQFNFVFASNPARPLYEGLGWRIVGTIPGAVHRPGGAVEDALIYWRPVGAGRPAPTSRSEPEGGAEPEPGPTVPAAEWTGSRSAWPGPGDGQARTNGHDHDAAGGGQAFDLLQSALGRLAAVDTAGLRAEVEAALRQSDAAALRQLVEGLLRHRPPD